MQALVPQKHNFNAVAWIYIDENNINLKIGCQLWAENLVW